MDMRLALQACWNLRLAALFAAGPIAGLVLLALTFGMTIAMQRMAIGMAAFSLVLFGILIKGEYDRLARRPRL
jgi:hypothetical protein